MRRDARLVRGDRAPPADRVPVLPRRVDEQILVCAPGALAGEQVRDLGTALGDVRRDRQAELRRRLRRARSTPSTEHEERCRAAPAPRTRRSTRSRISAKCCERPSRIGAEHLEVDRCTQAELGARHRGGAAVAAVADGGHTGREALRAPELRDVDVLVPADPRLALDVQGDPLGEVAETVTEASVHGVLEVRVRVDEAGNDHRIVVARAFAEIVGRADRGDQPVLDRRPRRPRSAGPRSGRTPVGGEDPVHGSVRLAASAGPRRSYAPSALQARSTPRRARPEGCSRWSSSPGRCREAARRSRRR